MQQEGRWLRQLLGHTFRPGNVPCAQPPHTFRVLMVGDSYCYGLGVAEWEALPHRLERILNRRASSGAFFEVVNLGRPGMSLFHERILLRQLAQDIDYDLLFLCLTSGDACPWQRHELAALSEDAEKQWNRQWHPDQVWFEACLRNLGSIAEEQRLLEKSMAVAFYEPVSGTSALPLAVLPAICHRLELPFLDLHSPFSGFVRETLMVSEADSHPSPMAHGVAAVEAADFLAPLLATNAEAPSVASDDALGRRLATLQASEAAQGAVGLLCYPHLVAHLEESWMAPHTKAIDEYRGLLNRLYRAQLHALLLRQAVAGVEMSTVQDQMLELGRLLLATELGLEGSDRAEAAILQAAGQGLGQTAELALSRLQAILDAAPIAVELTLGGPTLGQAIEALSEDASLRWSELNRRSRLEGEGLRTVFERSVALGQSCCRQTSISQEALRFLRDIAESVMRIASQLNADCAEDTSLDRAVLLASVAIPRACNAIHVDLLATCRVHIPYVQSHRQAHYVQADGKIHSFRIDLPPGTVCSVDVRFRLCHPGREDTFHDGSEFLQTLQLLQGSERRLYERQTLILSPFPSASEMLA